MSVAGPTVAQDQQWCAEHPDRRANGTCARCGRFVCGECVQAGAGLHCASCVRQLMAAVPPGAGLARWIARLLYASAGVSVATASLLVLGTPPVLEILEGLLGLIQLTLFITTGVTFLRWLHRAVRLAETLGADVGATPGWAVGYWFVPFVNLYRPYQVVTRLAAVIGARLPSGLQGWWWALWLISNGLDRATMRVPDPTDVLNIISYGVHAISALVFAGVVAGIERGLVERRASFAAVEALVAATPVAVATAMP